MRCTTATRTSMASTETQAREDGRVVQTRPRIGVLGIMQALYDDMLPGITERQAAYAAEVAVALGGVADVETAPPVKDRDDAERRGPGPRRRGPRAPAGGGADVR